MSETGKRQDIEGNPGVESECAEHLDIFMESASTTRIRNIHAWNAADPDYSIFDRDMPSQHQGYNLLCANWGSTEQHLGHIYRQFYYLSRNIARAKLYEPVIVGEAQPAGTISSIHDQPQAKAMDGPTRFKIGRLASNELEFQYRSRLQSGGNVLGNLKPPYLVAAARVQLEDLQDTQIDIGIHEVKSVKERASARAITLGSTLKENQMDYRAQNFAEISPVIVGQSACAEFLDRVKQEYMVSI